MYHGSRRGRRLNDDELLPGLLRSARRYASSAAAAADFTEAMA
jgi:hypothetical protein